MLRCAVCFGQISQNQTITKCIDEVHVMHTECHQNFKNQDILKKALIECPMCLQELSADEEKEMLSILIYKYHDNMIVQRENIAKNRTEKVQLERQLVVIKKNIRELQSIVVSADEKCKTMFGHIKEKDVIKKQIENKYTQICKNLCEADAIDDTIVNIVKQHIYIDREINNMIHQLKEDEQNNPCTPNEYTETLHTFKQFFNEKQNVDMFSSMLKKHKMKNNNMKNVNVHVPWAFTS